VAYISPIKLIGFYKGLVKPLYFIKYIYWRFRLLYLILLILLIRYLFSLSTLISRGGSYIYLGRTSNIGAVGQRTDI
jgi:hypothetical protein